MLCRTQNSLYGIIIKFVISSLLMKVITSSHLIFSDTLLFFFDNSNGLSTSGIATMNIYALYSVLESSMWIYLILNIIVGTKNEVRKNREDGPCSDMSIL